MDLKTKEARLKEGITLLKKLRETGLPDDDKGFEGIQKEISEWVKTGEARTASIPIYRAGRTAELDLPSVASKTAGIVLRVIH